MLNKWAYIINLHLIKNGTIRLNSIRRINKPIVWTIRDMWPFTGGCHYSLDCSKYLESCSNCPIIQKYKFFNITNRLHGYKNKIYTSKINLNLVSISSWVSECIKNRILKNHRNRIIFNPIDLTKFFPIDSITSRNILGLPLDRKILLVGSVKGDDRYKGWIEFVSSMKGLSSDILIVTFGKNISIPSIRHEVINMGYLADEVSMRLLYSSADVFVAPSIQEAFGKTVAESLACGTPCVAFNNSGPKDIIDHLVNGYLAKLEDDSDLTRGIDYFLNINKKEYTNNCVEKIRSRMSSDLIARQYMDYY